MSDPVLVEVTRGGRVESAHRGAVAVVDAAGALAFSLGDVEQPVYPRSAVKAIQALPLVESGAADRYGLTAAELALACSSHAGEPAHVAAAASMLARAGRSPDDLECGVHWPRERAARALAAAGKEPTALHNNCSGKHAGFICLSCAQGDAPAGYVHPEHPAMRRVTRALAELTGARLDAANMAVDGCSIPTYAIALRALAHGFARFGSGQGLPPDRAAAASRLRAAVADNPVMVGGPESFDTRLMQEMGARVFSKTGAEGVHCVALPELGLGVAIKCADGASRASEIATAAVLARLLPEAAGPLAPFVRRTLHNWNRIATGEIRPGGALA